MKRGRSDENDDDWGEEENNDSWEENETESKEDIWEEEIKKTKAEENKQQEEKERENKRRRLADRVAQLAAYREWFRTKYPAIIGASASASSATASTPAESSVPAPAFTTPLPIATARPAAGDIRSLAEERIRRMRMGAGERERQRAEQERERLIKAQSVLFQERMESKKRELARQAEEQRRVRLLQWRSSSNRVNPNVCENIQRFSAAKTTTLFSPSSSSSSSLSSLPPAVLSSTFDEPKAAFLSDIPPWKETIRFEVENKEGKAHRVCYDPIKLYPWLTKQYGKVLSRWRDPTFGGAIINVKQVEQQLAAAYARLVPCAQSQIGTAERTTPAATSSSSASAASSSDTIRLIGRSTMQILLSPNEKCYVSQGAYESLVFQEHKLQRRQAENKTAATVKHMLVRITHPDTLASRYEVVEPLPGALAQTFEDNAKIIALIKADKDAERKVTIGDLLHNRTEAQKKVKKARNANDADELKLAKDGLAAANKAYREYISENPEFKFDEDRDWALFSQRLISLRENAIWLPRSTFAELGIRHLPTSAQNILGGEKFADLYVQFCGSLPSLTHATIKPLTAEWVIVAMNEAETEELKENIVTAIQSRPVLSVGDELVVKHRSYVLPVRVMRIMSQDSNGLSVRRDSAWTADKRTITLDVYPPSA